METKIRDHVEYLFSSAPRTARAVEQKEELISNLTDRYADLIAQGETQEAAYGIAIAGIGDVEELIQGLQEPEPWTPFSDQEQRHKSAMLVATAVGLFIASVIFPVIFFSLGDWFSSNLLGFLGIVCMLLCIAVGVSLLVYNATVKPAPPPPAQGVYAPTPEEEAGQELPFQAAPFAEKKGKLHPSPLQKTIQSIIWTAAVPLYLMMGLFLGAWHPGWLIFLLAPVLSNIVRLIFLLKEEEQ